MQSVSVEISCNSHITLTTSWTRFHLVNYNAETDSAYGWRLREHVRVAITTKQTSKIWLELTPEPLACTSWAKLLFGPRRDMSYQAWLLEHSAWMQIHSWDEEAYCNAFKGISDCTSSPVNSKNNIRGYLSYGQLNVEPITWKVENLVTLDL